MGVVTVSTFCNHVPTEIQEEFHYFSASHSRLETLIVHAFAHSLIQAVIPQTFTGRLGGVHSYRMSCPDRSPALTSISQGIAPLPVHPVPGFGAGAWGTRENIWSASRGRAAALSAASRPSEASRLPRSLPSAPPPAASRDAAAEPELPGLSRAKFVARGRCGCNHRG